MNILLPRLLLGCLLWQCLSSSNFCFGKESPRNEDREQQESNQQAPAKQVTIKETETKPSISITSKNSEIEFLEGPDSCILNVECPRGIGQATLSRNTDNWPKLLQFRLALKGLENFEVSNGKETLIVFVSSDKNKQSRCSLRIEGKEMSLTKQHKFFTEATFSIVKLKQEKTEQEKSDSDKTKKYFQITLPNAFLKSNPASVEVRWIDFYR